MLFRLNLVLETTPWRSWKIRAPAKRRLTAHSKLTSKERAEFCGSDMVGTWCRNQQFLTVQEISKASQGAEYGDPLGSPTLAGAEDAAGNHWQPLAAPTKNPDEVSTFKFHPDIFSWCRFLTYKDFGIAANPVLQHSASVVEEFRDHFEMSQDAPRRLSQICPALLVEHTV